MKILILLVFGLLALDTGYTAGSVRSTGAVLTEDCEASIGATKPGKTVIHLKAGTFVAFMEMQALAPKWGEYKSDAGVIRGVIIQNNDKGSTDFAWIPEEKLSLFPFDTDQPNQSPFQVQGLKSQWSLSYKMAAQAKCKELGIKPASPAFLPEAKAKK